MNTTVLAMLQLFSFVVLIGAATFVRWLYLQLSSHSGVLVDAIQNLKIYAKWWLIEKKCHYERMRRQLQFEIGSRILAIAIWLKKTLNTALSEERVMRFVGFR